MDIFSVGPKFEIMTSHFVFTYFQVKEFKKEPNFTVFKDAYTVACVQLDTLQLVI